MAFSVNKTGSQPALRSFTIPHHVCQETISRMPIFNAGQQIGGFTISGILGAGAMGVVLKAHNGIKDIALKVSTDPDDLSDESEAIGRLKGGPNIVGFHGEGEHEGLSYLVFDYIEGEPLSEVLLERRKLTLPQAIQKIMEVATALEHCAINNVAHRDIKPANVMVRRDTGEAVLVDFGLADVVDPSDKRPLNHRYDILRLGWMSHQMLTGEAPLMSGTQALPAIHADPKIQKAAREALSRMTDPNNPEQYQDYGTLLADMQRLKELISQLGAKLSDFQLQLDHLDN